MIENKLRELKSILDYTLKQVIKNVNSEFTKAPIDTGLMLKTTKMSSITLNVKTLDMSIEIYSQEYLKYVENGWGSNRKYGERKVRENAIQHPDVQSAIGEVYSAMVEEQIINKLRDKQIRKVRYRV